MIYKQCNYSICYYCMILNWKMWKENKLELELELESSAYKKISFSHSSTRLSMKTEKWQKNRPLRH